MFQIASRGAAGGGTGGTGGAQNRVTQAISNGSPYVVDLTDGPNETPGTLHLTLGSGDTVQLDYSDTGPAGPWTAWRALSSGGSPYSLRIPKGTAALRLTRTAGSSSDSEYTYEYVVPPASIARDLGAMTWAELQASFPDGGAALLGLPAGTAVYVIDRALVYRRNPAGSAWRPASGSVLSVLGGLNGGTPGPVATGVGPTATLYQYTFPANTFQPGDSLLMRAKIRRRGATATADVSLRFGNLGSASDPLVRTQAFSATDTLDWRANIDVDVLTSTSYTTTNANNANTTSTGSFATRSANCDMTLPMVLGIYLSAANAADSFDVLSVHLERR